MSEEFINCWHTSQISFTQHHFFLLLGFIGEISVSFKAHQEKFREILNLQNWRWRGNYWQIVDLVKKLLITVKKFLMMTTTLVSDNWEFNRRQSKDFFVFVCIYVRICVLFVFCISLRTMASADNWEFNLSKAEKSSNFRSMSAEMTWLLSKPPVLVVRVVESLTNY